MTPSVSSELSAMQQILRALAPLAVPGAAPALLLKRVLCGCCKELGPLDLGILVSRARAHTLQAGSIRDLPHVALGRWGKPQGPCMCSSSVLPWAELEEGGVGYRDWKGSKTHPPPPPVTSVTYYLQEGKAGKGDRGWRERCQRKETGRGRGCKEANRHAGVELVTRLHV